MAAAKKTTARGRKQDRARVAGGQDYEVRYESKKTGRSAPAVKKAVKKVGNARKRVEKRIAGSIGRARDEAGVTSMIANANRRLFEEMFSSEGRPGMGTTIVGVLYFDREALVFNVGDSRAYELRRGQMLQLSQDDTLNANRGRRGARSHALTQSLGGTTKPLALRPHIRRLPFEDHIGVLLCSDGLSDMVQEDEIVRVLSSHSDDPAERLVAAALDAGGKDNVTVIVIGPKTVCGCQTLDQASEAP
jgi:serine/threonine protein phosphatase PrpC